MSKKNSKPAVETVMINGIPVTKLNYKPFRGLPKKLMATLRRLAKLST